MPFDFHGSYEALNPNDRDYRFYANFAARRELMRVVDLGCGTGVLAVSLAQAGHDVLGVDPDIEMLRVARDRSGSGLVRWLLGDAAVLPVGWADLVVMTGHVAQVFRSDDEWSAVLGQIRRGLTPGGTLAFETRNPAVRAWERWTRDQSLRVVPTDDGPVEFWHDLVSVELPLVTYATSARTAKTEYLTRDLDTLAFRDEVVIRSSLTSAGFTVDEIFGDWDSGPFEPDSQELIVTARSM